MQCKDIEIKTAPIKYALVKGLTCNKEPSSDKALKALNISINTNTVKDKVEAFYFPTVKYLQGCSSNWVYFPWLCTLKSFHPAQSVQFLS